MPGLDPGIYERRTLADYMGSIPDEGIAVGQLASMRETFPDWNALREAIADALYKTGAYELPSVAERLGFAPGTSDEAFQSKRRYVKTRADKLDGSQLLEVAKCILIERSDYKLDEIVAKITEAQGSAVSEVTRRKILAELNAVQLSGSVELLEFLTPLWPLGQQYVSGRCLLEKEEMESFIMYGGLWTIGDEIRRRCIDSSDWDNEQLLKQVGALTCSQARFFAQLEAIVHPRTRNESEQRTIVRAINRWLRPDGFAMRETGQVSGQPLFSVIALRTAEETPADAEISETLATFDEDSVHAAWMKALARRQSDPEGAITAARCLIETVCKHVLDDEGVPYPDEADLPKLWRLCAQRLNLAPDQHTEDAFKRVLGSCQSAVETLGTLRNRLSDAHGKGRHTVKPSARHAQLAVNLAGAMTTFLISTQQARKSAIQASPPIQAIGVKSA